ncbi:hypothetical protein F4X86_03895 [Candidatus Saccharibacteria bacterium]|nr:hypothetical protein [Candidatus Saccharibacteria bacterium]
MDNDQDNYAYDDPYGFGAVIINWLRLCSWLVCSFIILVIARFAVDEQPQNTGEAINLMVICVFLIAPLVTAALWLLGMIIMRARRIHIRESEEKESDPERLAAG